MLDRSSLNQHPKVVAAAVADAVVDALGPRAVSATPPYIRTIKEETRMEVSIRAAQPSQRSAMMRRASYYRGRTYFRTPLGFFEVQVSESEEESKAIKSKSTGK